MQNLSLIIGPALIFLFISCSSNSEDEPKVDPSKESLENIFGKETIYLAYEEALQLDVPVITCDDEAFDAPIYTSDEIEVSWAESDSHTIRFKSPVSVIDVFDGINWHEICPPYAVSKPSAWIYYPIDIDYRDVHILQNSPTELTLKKSGNNPRIFEIIVGRIIFIQGSPIPQKKINITIK